MIGESRLKFTIASRFVLGLQPIFYLAAFNMIFGQSEEEAKVSSKEDVGDAGDSFSMEFRE